MSARCQPDEAIAVAAEQEVSARLRGRPVRLVCDVNSAELARRDAVGLGAVTNATLLRVLASLPVGEPFNWSMLDAREQQILRAAPAGVIERAGARAVRLAVVPVLVRRVYVSARLAHLGLVAASRFAPFCERVARLPRAAVGEPATVEAAFYGIGVQVRQQRRWTDVVAPEVFTVKRWSWASWQFHEEAYGEIAASVPGS